MRVHTKKRQHTKPKTTRRRRRYTRKRIQKKKNGGTWLNWLNDPTKKPPPDIEIDLTSAVNHPPSKDAPHPVTSIDFSNVNLYEIINNVERIGEESSNGYIYSLTSKEVNTDYNNFRYGLDDTFTFTNNEFNKYVFKIAKDRHADNLFYEYIAGKYINEFIKYVPFFTKTYGLFKYNPTFLDFFRTDNKSTITEQNIRNLTNKTNLVPADILSKYTSTVDVDKFKIDFNDVCEGEYCILLENVENVQNIEHLYDDHIFLINDLLKILYQVYMTLDMFKFNFTHYDLHLNNILICKLPPGIYITHHYAYEDAGKDEAKFVEFNSEYYIKIIDYGRCFFKSINGINTSARALHLGCILNTCVKYECGNCGDKCGFIRDRPQDANRPQITTSIESPSADLKYINYWLRIVSNPSFDFFKNHYNKFSITNISQVHMLLKRCVKKMYNGTDENNIANQNKYYAGMTCMQTLFIKADKLDPGMNHFYNGYSL